MGDQVIPVLDSAGTPIAYGDTVVAPVPKLFHQLYGLGEFQRVLIRAILWKDSRPYVLYLFQGALLSVPACKCFKVQKGEQDA